MARMKSNSVLDDFYNIKVANSILEQYSYLQYEELYGILEPVINHIKNDYARLVLEEKICKRFKAI